MKLKTLLKSFEGPLFVYVGNWPDSAFLGKIYSVGKNGFYTSAVDYQDAEQADVVYKLIEGVLDSTVEKTFIAGNDALTVYLK